MGLGGKLLTVISINGRTSITVSNGTGASISVSAGTRLILVSDPVTVYTDAAGSTAASDVNSIDSTSESPDAVWVPRPHFDRIGAAGEVGYNDSSSTTLPASGATMTWSHNAGGADRLVLVGVAWQETLGVESLDSVTYDGVAMTLLAESDFSSVYYMVNLPTGTKSIVATWSGSGAKGAIGGAVSLTNVDQSRPLEAPGVATGNSTSPMATVSRLPGLLFAHLGLNAAGSSVTVGAGSGATQRWNAEAGSSGASTLTQGSGATRPSSGATAAVNWTLSASRVWAVISVVVRPRVTALTIESAGSLVPSTAWVDARNFADLQAAADAVPPGGTLHIPNGDWTVPSGGLVIERSMCVQGEPGTRLYPNSVTEDQPVVRLIPGGGLLSRVTIRDLQLLNAAKPDDSVEGNYGIQCDVPSDGSQVLRLIIDHVAVSAMGDDGIHLHAEGDNDSNFVFVTMRDVDCVDNRGRGLYAAYAFALNLHGCYFLSNDLEGLRCESCEVTCYACGFEKNCTSQDTQKLSATYGGQVYLRTCAGSRIDGCHFEEFTGDAHPVNKRGLYLDNSVCCVVSGCTFVNETEDSSSSARGIVCTFSPESAGVMACAILPNKFRNVYTAIEIDASTGSAAQDCVVFPQRIDVGTGEMILPTALSDSGLVVLGNRRLGTDGLARGVFVPPRVNTAGDPLPALTGDDAGYMLYDRTNQVLRVWSGSVWQSIAFNP